MSNEIQTKRQKAIDQIAFCNNVIFNLKMDIYSTRWQWIDPNQRAYILNEAPRGIKGMEREINILNNYLDNLDVTLSLPLIKPAVQRQLSNDD